MYRFVLATILLCSPGMLGLSGCPVQSSLPDAPSSPGPAEEAADISPWSSLDWADTMNATSYDVYLGTTDPPPFVSSTSSSKWTPDYLLPGTIYYWRIVAINSAGETPGPVWQFSTASQPQTPCETDDACRATTNWLNKTMDQFHETLDVYSDSDAAGNHFAARGQMNSPGDDDALPAMDEAWTADSHSGTTAIMASFDAKGDNWGGWYFMNGILQGTETSPRENWGYQHNAGMDLRGATNLTFSARGAHGGERVEFFAFGVGRDPSTGAPLAPDVEADSSRKVSTGYISLASEWRQYTLDLGGSDLSYVLGGFGWVTNASENGGEDITFYLDDIRYEKSRLDQARFLVSYETGAGPDFDTVMRNVAYTYDNALAAIAFIATGQRDRAKLIVDALVYAQQHDRFYTDGRLRNAYQAGDLALPPGWTPNNRSDTVRMPGWYDTSRKRWLEDKVQVSTYTGNVAWAMLAILAYCADTSDTQYLAAVEQMGDWVESKCRDTRGAGGYMGGFEGWEPSPDPLTYKSTEHNLDLYAAFQRLYKFTGDEKWQERATHARNFVLAMFDPVEGKFWTGTTPDGVTVNETVIPVDVQAWAILSLRLEDTSYVSALDYAEQHLKVDDGFDFNQDRDGIWNEGTAQMAAAYQATGQYAQSRVLLDYLRSSRMATGAIRASNKNGLTTGFDLPPAPDGTVQPWLYFDRAHVGASAWFILAVSGVNPFWAGSE